MGDIFQIVTVPPIESSSHVILRQVFRGGSKLKKSPDDYRTGSVIERSHEAIESCK